MRTGAAADDGRRGTRGARNGRDKSERDRSSLGPWHRTTNMEVPVPVGRHGHLAGRFRQRLKTTTERPGTSKVPVLFV
ncbi:hypothetical protein GCM10010415_63870 [Streptomyces atrovirens]